MHRRLYSGEDVQHVEMREYLEPLVAELEQAWTSPGSPRAVRLIADPVSLNTDRAVSVGIIVNELVTNACKYAYPLEAPGEVRVTLSGDGERRFTLTVEDDGCGMPADGAPRGNGPGRSADGGHDQDLARRPGDRLQPRRGEGHAQRAVLRPKR